MGLQRLWLIPHGAEPKDGVYLHCPLDDLLDLTALESRRHHCIVIGEDLGTVPEGLRPRLRAAGILGMEVLWFQRDHHGFMAPDRWSKTSAAMTTTHDLPTVAGWWRGCDIDLPEKLGRRGSAGDPAAERAARARGRAELWSALRDAGAVQGAPPEADRPESVVEAAIDFIAMTPCDLAIVPIEDVLGLAAQPNVPGTVDEHPNWRQRLPAGDPLGSPAAQRNLRGLRRARGAPRPAAPATTRHRSASES
jgi:4-alpha-glucanotransferase